jgi:hypothetical protein
MYEGNVDVGIGEVAPLGGRKDRKTVDESPQEGKRKVHRTIIS